MTTITLSLLIQMMSLIDEEFRIFFESHYCVSLCYSDETTKLQTS